MKSDGLLCMSPRTSSLRNTLRSLGDFTYVSLGLIKVISRSVWAAYPPYLRPSFLSFMTQMAAALCEGLKLTLPELLGDSINITGVAIDACICADPRVMSLAVSNA